MKTKEYIKKIAKLTIMKLGLYYQAFLLTDSSREKILKLFPPKFSNVVAHHVTHAFNSPNELPENPKVVKVVGIAENDSVQALVVSIDGTTKRPDGGTYHITLSLGDGAKAKDSNSLIAKDGYKKVTPVVIDIYPSVETKSKAA